MLRDVESCWEMLRDTERNWLPFTSQGHPCRPLIPFNTCLFLNYVLYLNRRFDQIVTNHKCLRIVEQTFWQISQLQTCKKAQTCRHCLRKFWQIAEILCLYGYICFIYAIKNQKIVVLSQIWYNICKYWCPKQPKTSETMS